eukprot:bmy_22685T0
MMTPDVRLLRERRPRRHWDDGQPAPQPQRLPCGPVGTAAWRTGPCQAPRKEEPAGPESKSKAAPSLDNLTWPPTADTLIFVVVLPTGCALHVPLDDVDVVLEPEPASVRQVSLGDRILMLVPKALVGLGIEHPLGQGLERDAFLLTPGEYIALEQGFFCSAVPEIAAKKRPKGGRGHGC